MSTHDMLVSVATFGSLDTATPLNHYLLSEEEVLVGRAPNCQLQLDNDTVSLAHIKIIHQDNHLLILDLGSANGTRHKGRNLVPYQAETLQWGDSVQIGNLSLLFAATEKKQNTFSTTRFAQDVVQKLLAGQRTLAQTSTWQDIAPHLEIISGANIGQRYPLNSKESHWLMGRSNESQHIIEDGKVSSQHLRIQKQGREYHITDLGSKHGFGLNGVLNLRQATLSHGDLLMVGDSQMQFNCLEQVATIAAGIASTLNPETGFTMAHALEKTMLTKAVAPQYSASIRQPLRAFIARKATQLTSAAVIAAGLVIAYFSGYIPF